MYYFSDWECRINSDTLTCYPPEGILVKNFLFVGKKLWVDQGEVIDKCIDAGLVEIDD